MAPQASKTRSRFRSNSTIQFITSDCGEETPVPFRSATIACGSTLTRQGSFGGIRGRDANKAPATMIRFDGDGG
jgi:hypothetical protein